MRAHALPAQLLPADTELHGDSLPRGPLELAVPLGPMSQQQPELLTCLNPRNPRWGIPFTPQTQPACAKANMLKSVVHVHMLTHHASVLCALSQHTATP